MTTLRRHLYLAGGWISLGLGVIGIFLPLLPTTPFVLLAAFCFSRGSEKLYLWLLMQPAFGPMLAEWHNHGMIRRRVKIIATLSMLGLLSYPLTVSSVPWWAKLSMGAVSLGVLVFIWSRPSQPHQ